MNQKEFSLHPIYFPVKCIVAQEGSFKNIISCSAEAYPKRKVKILTKVAGRIEAIYGNENEYIKKGEMLFRTEDPQLEYSYQQALAKATRSAIDFALEYTSHNSEDDEITDFLSEIKELDFSKASTGTLRRLDKFLVSHRSLFVKASYSGFYDNLLNLRKCKQKVLDQKCRAPFSGYIVDLVVQRYQNVSTNQECLTLIDESEIIIKMDVLEEYIEEIKKYNEVTVNFPALPETSFSCNITSISPLVDPQTKTFEVECVIGNKQGRINSGMFAFCYISSSSIENAVVVPKSAIIFSGEKPAIFLASGSRALFTKVKLGQENPNQSVILAGIEPGDTVIYEGHSTLSTDAQIKIQQIDTVAYE
ncbi:efflux RND transporter periplasmic adaptor subunit [bacterium]|nr:efflux RND transporter periplasmic adaptor subunit [bacterium]